MPIGIYNGNSRHMQYMRELQEEADRAARKERREKLKAEDMAVYQELIEIDPEGGEAWFDDNDNVPEYGSTRERIQIVRKRIDELKRRKERTMAGRLESRMCEIYQALAQHPDDSSELYRELAEIETWLYKNEPQEVGKAVAVASGTADLSLNEISDEQRRAWWNSTPMIDLSTGEEVK